MNPSFTRAAAAVVVLLSLAACATAPTEDLVESLDPKTAVTVVALAEPLVFTSERSTLKLPDDLALGPFEINRMGSKSWFLWASRLAGAPETAALARLRIVANGETLLELEPLARDAKLPVSAPPYRALAEWASQAYFPITADQLARLQGRAGLAVELAAGENGEWVRFDAWQGRTAAVDEFVSRQLTGRVADRD